MPLCSAPNHSACNTVAEAVRCGGRGRVAKKTPSHPPDAREEGGAIAARIAPCGFTLSHTDSSAWRGKTRGDSAAAWWCQRWGGRLADTSTGWSCCTAGRDGERRGAATPLRVPRRRAVKSTGVARKSEYNEHRAGCARNRGEAQKEHPHKPNGGSNGEGRKQKKNEDAHRGALHESDIVAGATTTGAEQEVESELEHATVQLTRTHAWTAMTRVRRADLGSFTRTMYAMRATKKRGDSKEFGEARASAPNAATRLRPCDCTV